MAKNKPPNRSYLRRTGVKWYCTTCGALKLVVDWYAGIEQAALECGHRRDAGSPDEENKS
jgi:hypothetical protein